jgi:very-short-patch-repair endonuclease
MSAMPLSRLGEGRVRAQSCDRRFIARLPPIQIFSMEGRRLRFATREQCSRMKRLNVDRAQGLRRNMTDAERLLWRHLRGRRFAGWKFRRQHEIGRYIVDFVCPSAGLVVELDGGQHAEQTERDAYRTRQLEALGYRVLRFCNNDVLKNGEGVLAVIVEALASVPPHPDPLPMGESGKYCISELFE